MIESMELFWMYFKLLLLNKLIIDTLVNFIIVK
jgi:hypothetical protein